MSGYQYIGDILYAPTPPSGRNYCGFILRWLDLPETRKLLTIEVRTARAFTGMKPVSGHRLASLDFMLGVT